MPKPNNVGVGVAILVLSSWDGQLLLLERQGAHAAGTLACPGGWVDFEDESPEATCVRELREELKLDVEESDLQQVCNVSEFHEDLSIRTVTMYYLLRHENWKHGVPMIGEPEKCSRLVWGYPKRLFPNLGQVLLRPVVSMELNLR